MNRATSPLSMLIGILLLLGVLYVFEVNRLSVQGYKLSDLETKKSEMMQKQTALSSTIAKKRAIERLENSELTKTMKDASFTHIKGSDTVVKR